MEATFPEVWRRRYPDQHLELLPAGVWRRIHLRSDQRESVHLRAAAGRRAKVEPAAGLCSSGPALLHPGFRRPDFSSRYAGVFLVRAGFDPRERSFRAESRTALRLADLSRRTYEEP